MRRRRALPATGARIAGASVSSHTLERNAVRYAYLEVLISDDELPSVNPVLQGVQRPRWRPIDDPPVLESEDGAMAGAEKRIRLGTHKAAQMGTAGVKHDSSSGLRSIDPHGAWKCRLDVPVGPSDSELDHSRLADRKVCHRAERDPWRLLAAPGG